AIRMDPSPLKSDLACHLALVHEVHRRRAEFVIIHFHVDMLHFPFFAQEAERTVTTLHGRLDLDDLPAAYARWPGFPLVSISDDQRRPLPGVAWVATVPHGLLPESYRLTVAPERPYLAFLGRISPEKRPDRAIEIARRTGLRLKIAAKVDAVDRAYFREMIEPLLSEPLVEFIGEIGDAEKSDFLGNASALLFPIDWPEPFGLVMIEAMACGTPVIAWNRGSVPEVVEHGISGFVVDDLDQAVAAVGRVDRLDRRRVRRSFERRFTAEVMARNYLRLYWRLYRDAQASRTRAAPLELTG
ncbi:MAG: glycosyltransferase family 4 protein, partial [Geminicoccaceae bacterium]